MRNEIKTIIDKLVENAIRQNGMENKKNNPNSNKCRKSKREI